MNVEVDPKMAFTFTHPSTHPLGKSTHTRTGGGLVQEDDLGVGEKFRANGQALAFTTREALDKGKLAAADDGVGATGQLHLPNVCMCVCVCVGE